MRSIIIILGMLLTLRAILYLTGLFYYNSPQMTYETDKNYLSTYEADQHGFNTGTDIEHYLKVDKKVVTYRDGLLIKSKIDTINIGFYNSTK